MADLAPNRRLAAILAADVVGYSRMMGADEAGTHWGQSGRAGVGTLPGPIG
jgi:class 3 adenylate cyclase